MSYGKESHNLYGVWEKCHVREMSCGKLWCGELSFRGKRLMTRMICAGIISTESGLSNISVGPAKHVKYGGQDRN